LGAAASKRRPLSCTDSGNSDWSYAIVSHREAKTTRCCLEEAHATVRSVSEWRSGMNPDRIIVERRDHCSGLTASRRSRSKTRREAKDRLVGFATVAVGGLTNAPPVALLLRAAILTAEGDRFTSKLNH
jgi:hypothetical protein